MERLYCAGVMRDLSWIKLGGGLSESVLKSSVARGGRWEDVKCVGLYVRDDSVL